MTLSRWLRDYLYIPLGGAGTGETRTAINIMITMLLGGLWHGAAWTFVAWGAFHGIGQLIGRWRVRRNPVLAAPATGWVLARQRIVTFNLVCVGWVLFRADSIGSAFELLASVFTPRDAHARHAARPARDRGLDRGAIPAADPAIRLREGFSRLGPVVQGAALAVVLFLITTLGPSGVSPFIYFRF